ncbi:MAG: class II glutamine amidotransferase, partial [Bacteroidales bacterium]|nr:class II glutamine amidotransferase [Bacteroidales bacterium]
RVKAEVPDLEAYRDKSMDELKMDAPFCGELLLGHVRYGTFGGNTLENTHPFIRESNWKSRNLIIAGNFNLTNVKDLFYQLVGVGQHPVNMSDARIVLEKLAARLDHDNQKLYDGYRAQGYNKLQISEMIPRALDLRKIVSKVAQEWDGGYVFAGMVGYGDAFVVRDPNGIRPAFYYKDDEMLVVASERPVIQTTFNVPLTEVHELPPAGMIWAHHSGEVEITDYMAPAANPRPCSFERIYFSRGTDADIYNERKRLGALLRDDLLKAIDYDLENTVFSSIPNTAQVAFHGLSEALEQYCDTLKITRLQELQVKHTGLMLTDDQIRSVLDFHPRTDQIVVKDAKMRTFITQDKDRDDLVSHVYDVTYGKIREYKDTLVVLDDSVVRGTTLRRSILRILDRLGPKRIVVASSAPQIRYPDCYGIDMAKMGDLIAFQAAISLLKRSGQERIIAEVYNDCRLQLRQPLEKQTNSVKRIYSQFSYEEISDHIAELLTTKGMNAEVKVVFQTVENLHKACPRHTGDWYFTGDYPTPGGNSVVNRAFVYYMDNRDDRPY